MTAPLASTLENSTMAELLSAARLHEIRDFAAEFWKGPGPDAMRDLLAHIDAQAAEIAALKAQLATAREGAALAAETVSHAPGYIPPEPPSAHYSLGFAMGKHAAAEAIRALKDQTP
jgi:hypothetical protein